MATAFFAAMVSIKQLQAFYCKRRCAMKKNMGAIDRGIRLLVAIVLTVLLAVRVLSGVAGIILGVIALILLVTSLIGFCPLYVPLKISTKKQE
jgi:hypothetical protein